MRLTHLLLVATVTAITAAPTTAEVTYQGDVDAVAICKAIMNDDKSQLKRAIREASSQHERLRAVRIAEKTFACNGMELAEYAAQVGSNQALSVFVGDVDERIAAR